MALSAEAHLPADAICLAHNLISTPRIAPATTTLSMGDTPFPFRRLTLYSGTRRGQSMPQVVGDGRQLA
jgi:hypothetical protein